MKIAFLNPQGNFDPQDSYWTQHPDFGGQLVYVKEVAVALAALGHQADILTRQIIDPDWPEFEAPLDGYPGVENVRIVRLPCGPRHFLPKEALWPHLGTEWLPRILDFYRRQGGLPDAFTAHYADGGLAGALLKKETGIPFTFTSHSLGAQKMEKLGVSRASLTGKHADFYFPRRIFAERVSMNHAGCVVTSTAQERLEQYAHRAYRNAIDPGDDARFAVIPPGVNRRIFSPSPGQEDEAVRRRIEAALARDVAEGRRRLPLVVASSRLDEKKNHVGLLKAFCASRDLRERANLAIVVRGLEDPLHHYATLNPAEKTIMNEVTALMTAHGLWGQVTAFPLNSQQELAAAYRCLAQRHSVFALTALYEPFGLAPLEAMSCGLPAVVTQNGGPAESMRQGEQEFGVLIDPADPEDVARGLLRVLGAAESWLHFRQAGVQRVLSRYTWQRSAEGYLAAIEDVLRDPARSGDLAIPSYFTCPGPQTDIPLADLAALYFE